MTEDRLEDATLWRSVETTLREVVAPALRPGHELDTVVQLQGLARWAACRGADDADVRAAQLSRALGAPPGTSLPAALKAATRELVAVVADPGEAAATARTAAARSVLLDHLDRDVDAAAPLLASFAGHPARDVEPTERHVPGEELAALVGWFERALAGPVDVRRAVVLAGGHSRRMLRLDLDGPAGPASYVVRVEQGGTFGTDGTLEGHAMRALTRAGVPVAPVRWIEPDAAPLGQPFFVMDLVAGGSGVNEAAMDAFVAALHEVHRVDPAALTEALGPPPAPEEAVAGQIDRWDRLHHDAVDTPLPLLEEAAAWLRRELRPTGPVVVVHGDPGPGNFLSHDGVLTAITDWEFVHYGDAAEDWSYLATSRGRKLRSAPQWYDHLERRLGVRHGHATWHAWEAFNQYKGACANLTAMRLFRDGRATTPNLLAIGTAVHARFLRRLADLVHEARSYGHTDTEG